MGPEQRVIPTRSDKIQDVAPLPASKYPTNSSKKTPKEYVIPSSGKIIFLCKLYIACS